MRLVTWGIALAVGWALAGTASAQGVGWRTVKLPLVAEPLPPEAYAEREVKPDEVFMVQRLSAVRSATLQADVSVPGTMGEAGFAKGAQLFLALGAANEEYWCGTYSPRRPSDFMGWHKIQWVCFEDADRDLAFEAFYTTPPNAGSFLPSFDRIQGPRSTPAGPVAYVLDEGTARPYFESAVAWQKTFNIYNRLFFWNKVRLGGEGEWSDATSTMGGVMGGYTSVGGKPPLAASTGGAAFTVTERGRNLVKVRPDGMATGVVTFAITSTYGGF